MFSPRRPFVYSRFPLTLLRGTACRTFAARVFVVAAFACLSGPGRRRNNSAHSAAGGGRRCSATGQAALLGNNAPVSLKPLQINSGIPPSERCGQPVGLQGLRAASLPSGSGVLCCAASLERVPGRLSSKLIAFCIYHTATPLKQQPSSGFVQLTPFTSP